MARRDSLVYEFSVIEVPAATPATWPRSTPASARPSAHSERWTGLQSGCTGRAGLPRPPASLPSRDGRSTVNDGTPQREATEE